MFTTSCATWILITFFAVGISQDVDENASLKKTCKARNYDSEGSCVLLSECRQALALLMLGDFKSLNSMHCGFSGSDIKVCCPNTNSTSQDPIVFDEKEKNIFINTNQNSISNINLTESTTAAPTIPTPDVTTISPELHTNKPHNKSEAPNKLYEQTAFSQSVTNDNSDNFINSLPDRRTCGIFAAEDKIYGGEIASIDEFPWLARIRYKTNLDKEVYACTGSLINNRYILTVAHCVANLTLVDVRLGEWDEETDVDCYDAVCSDPPIDVKIDKMIIHPNYSASMKSNDIALLRLAQSVNFTDFVRPVCLPTTSYIIQQDYVPESIYTIAGWGMTEFGIKSAVKRKLRVKAVEMSDCRLAFPIITDTLARITICAGGRKGEDSCKGDSGGSLARQVSENYNTNWFLYGLTSFGVGVCGTEGRPGLYTRVTRYMDWIVDNIQKG